VKKLHSETPYQYRESVARHLCTASLHANSAIQFSCKLVIFDSELLNITTRANIYKCKDLKDDSELVATSRIKVVVNNYSGVTVLDAKSTFHVLN
jgi:hypothetical protein